MTSRLVKDTTKRSVLAQLPRLAAGADCRVVEAAALYAVRENVRLSADTLLIFAQAGVTESTMMALLAPVLPETPAEALMTILQAIGGPYGRLALPGHRPVTLLDDPAHRDLAEHLKKVGHVSSYRMHSHGANIKVNMKHQ
jgi:hypothetical protein